MGKLKDTWDAYSADWRRNENALERAITEAEETIQRLTRERDEARSKLFPYAEATEISGFSWGGLYIIGNKASIKAVKTAIHQAGQIEEYRAAFKQREEALTRERDEAHARMDTYQVMAAQARDKALDEAATVAKSTFIHESSADIAGFKIGNAILALKGDKP